MLVIPLILQSGNLNIKVNAHLKEIEIITFTYMSLFEKTEDGTTLI